MPRKDLETNQLSPENLNNNQVDCLCAIVRQASQRGKTLFIGWTAEGKPAITSDISSLTPKARESYNLSLSAKQKIPNIPFNEIVPVKFEVVGKVIDLQDDGETKTQDLLTLSTINEKGENIKINIQELSFLNAVINCRVKWQEAAGGSLFETDAVIPSKPMYTVFINDAADENTTYALLFKPTVEGESNEVAFNRFIIESLNGLIQTDKRQEPGSKKGYIKALESFIGKRTDLEPGMAYDFYVIAKELGILDVSQETIEELRQESAGQSLLVQFFILLNTAGVIENYHPRPKGFKIEKLEDLKTEELLELTAHIKRVVEASF